MSKLKTVNSIVKQIFEEINEQDDVPKIDMNYIHLICELENDDDTRLENINNYKLKIREDYKKYVKNYLVEYCDLYTSHYSENEIQNILYNSDYNIIECALNTVDKWSKYDVTIHEFLNYTQILNDVIEEKVKCDLY